MANINVESSLAVLKKYKFIQVLVGIIAVFVLYNIGKYILKEDDILYQPNNYEVGDDKTAIFIGFIEANKHFNRTYNTMYLDASNYIDLKRSVNKQGGAQFTYQFWIYVDNPEYLIEENQKILEGEDQRHPFPIFIKGDPQRYNYEHFEDMDKRSKGKFVRDHTSFCPKVTFGNKNNEIIVSFNTTKAINEQVSIIKKDSDRSTRRHNVLSLQPRKWIMYTIVFLDNIPVNDFETGLIVKLYVNELLYKLDTFPNTAIRQNNGDFVLLPDGPANVEANLRISNLCYFNHAVAENEIVGSYNLGPNLTPVKKGNMDDSDRFMKMSSKNKLDIYNI